MDIKIEFGAANQFVAPCPRQEQVRVGGYQCTERCKFYDGGTKDVVWCGWEEPEKES